MGDIIGYNGFIKAPGGTFESINKSNTKINKEEQEVLYWLLHNKAEQKIVSYGRKITDLENKYGMDFSTFQNKIRFKETEGNFEEWNDFILWGGYIKAYCYWQQFCQNKSTRR
ncbi:MAG: hypothetical protein ACPK85_04850 [Methanosarcina sp.]